ncbi:DNA end protector [Pseudomonas phage PspYZU05]|uniref:DNA end protector protein n=1 Tax=Pseudomonas phage PspYZU05 TaxID=1983556 RepID=A0A2U7N2H2_9CAUD|nr:DNA end protector [Pseudomonas phage PspYZU05]ASD52060.1 DNA end protector protein [Pseudomonas phage PspYZU05]
MSIFILEQNETRTSAKTKQKWIQIGIEYYKAKRQGVTAKQFAEQNEIKYSTFTSGMSRYQNDIKQALTAEAISNKPDGKLSRKERELKLINSFRSSIRSKIANEGAASNNKSAKWFENTMKTVKSFKATKPSPGKLYAYAYDAKHKDTLPYWDKYPLIIFLGTGTQGSSYLMYGLNLHYIPPKARQEFLESLLKQYASTPVISNSTRLKIDWSKVKGFKGADKMIKAYLPGHIKGPIIEIKPQDWANVVLLPTQQFMSGGKRYSANKVWRS